MAIVRFQQDTEKPFGTGNFIDDKGASHYLTDPGTASKFVDTLPGQGGGSAPGGLGVSAVGAGVPTPAGPAQEAPPAADLSDVSAVGPAVKPGTPMANIKASGILNPLPGGPKTEAAKVQGALASTTQPPVLASTAPGATEPGGAPALPAPAVSAAPAPAPGAPAVLELAGQTTVSGGSVQKGRDKKAVQAQIDAEEKAGTELDTSLLDQGRAADERATGAIDREKEGVAAAEERERNRVIDEQLKQQTIKDKLDSLNAELKANDEKLDPDQYMKSMSSGKKLGMVILAALSGGFGSLIGQKENQVLAAVDSAIDQNIDKQKQEIAAGRARIGNDIAEFMRKGHSAEEAEALARDRANSAVDKQFELDAKRLGIQGQQLEQAQTLVKQRQEARAARRGELMSQTEDRIQTQWQTTKTMQQKQSGVKPMSEKEFYETQQARLAYQNAALDRANTAEIAEAIGHDISAQEGQRIKDRIREVGPGLGETAGAVNMTTNLVEALGGKIDSTTGKIEWPSDLKASGLWDQLAGKVNQATLEKAGLSYSDLTRAQDAQAALKEFVTKNLTGATASPEQIKTFTAMVGADLSNEGRVKEQLQNWANTLMSMRREQINRLGADGMRYYQKINDQAKRGAEAPPLQERGAPAAAPAAVPPLTPRAAPAPAAAPPIRPTQPAFTPANPLSLQPQNPIALR